jgi:transposase-like protein
LSSVETYIRNCEWRDARLTNCPLHPSGGCSFARHGSYARAAPRGLRIARWYCPEGRRTFSLLPDFLAARLPDLLAAIEHSITVASSAKSMEAAADALRGPDVSLPGAVRWLRRRIRAVRTALAHVTLKTVISALATEPALEIDLNEGRVLLGLRRSLSPQILNSIPAPLGFRPAGGVGWPRGGNGQHGMGPDGQVGGRYGPAVDANQARWIRSNNALPKSRPPPRICSRSGAPIAACETAAPAFTSNGSSGSAPIVRDMGSMNAAS